MTADVDRRAVIRSGLICGVALAAGMSTFIDQVDRWLSTHGLT